MAELTNLEEKLAEVIGLAMAAQTATDKVAKLDEAKGASGLLERMNAEAAETEERGKTVVEAIEGRKTAILEKSRTTKSKAGRMLETYLDEEADALDGFEFLTMAEAGEVGHWRVLRQMAEKAGRGELVALAEWALPIQERHLRDAQETSLKLAAEEDRTSRRARAAPLGDVLPHSSAAHADALEGRIELDLREQCGPAHKPRSGSERAP